MRAAIDIGSNSIRLALSDGTGRSTITKLADGIDRTGKLSPVGISATLDALREYAKVCRAAGCDSITAFATEAVRRAADGAQFCAAVKAEINLDVLILSAEQEARQSLRPRSPSQPRSRNRSRNRSPRTGRLPSSTMPPTKKGRNFTPLSRRRKIFSIL